MIRSEIDPVRVEQAFEKRKSRRQERVQKRVRVDEEPFQGKVKRKKAAAKYVDSRRQVCDKIRRSKPEYKANRRLRESTPEFKAKRNRQNKA